MLIKDEKFWKKIIENAEGYVYNDFGTQFPGDVPTWNKGNFNKLHRGHCSELKKMTYITQGKYTKHYFETEQEAIKWIQKNVGPHEFSVCTKCRIKAGENCANCGEEFTITKEPAEWKQGFMRKLEIAPEEIRKRVKRTGYYLCGTCFEDLSYEKYVEEMKCKTCNQPLTKLDTGGDYQGDNFYGCLKCGRVYFDIWMKRKRMDGSINDHLPY